MARSHEFNNLNNHVHIMETQIARYAYAFDDSFDEFTPKNSQEPLAANRLHFDDQVTDFFCIGEFRFSRTSEHHHWVLLTIEKILRVQEHGSIRFSQTLNYKYNIRLNSPKKADQKFTRVLRFDNRDAHGYGYSTPNHLHIQVDSESKKHRDWPFPAHVDQNFPYMSDAFDISIYLAHSDVGPTAKFDELLTAFSKIPRPARARPVDWVPPMKFDLISFVL